MHLMGWSMNLVFLILANTLISFVGFVSADRAPDDGSQAQVLASGQAGGPPYTTAAGKCPSACKLETLKNASPVCPREVARESSAEAHVQPKEGASVTNSGNKNGTPQGANSGEDRTAGNNNGSINKTTGAKTSGGSSNSSTSGDGSGSKRSKTSSSKSSRVNPSSHRQDAQLRLSLWDSIVLILLGVLALASSAALIDASFIGDLWRRFCYSCAPLRRLLRKRNKAKIKLQVLAAEYERVVQARSRIAVRCCCLENIRSI